ncbi:hypothetical protein MHYP_G00142850 [Metynnis hypsauchen]
MDPISAAHTAYSAVTSFGTVSHALDRTRNVSIQISNFSNFTFTDPRTHIPNGYCKHPPRPTLRKKDKDECSFSKTPLSVFGVKGILTYDVLNNEKECVGKLAIKFSVPHSFYDYRFALGFCETNIDIKNIDLGVGEKVEYLSTRRAAQAGSTTPVDIVSISHLL